MDMKEIDRLQESIAALQQENEWLRARAQDWESAHQAQKERVEFLQQENERLKAEARAALARAEEVLK